MKYSHTEETGELPTSLPIGCTLATEWAARGNFAMQIRLSTTSIYEKSGQLSEQQSGLPMGILPCKLGYPLLPYMETVGSSVGSPLFSNMKKVGSSVGSGVGYPWLPMGILPCKLCCQLLQYTDIVGNSVGSPPISNMKIVGSSVGSPLNRPLLNSKWKPSLIHMQDICSTCLYTVCYSK